MVISFRFWGSKRRAAQSRGRFGPDSAGARKKLLAARALVAFVSRKSDNLQTLKALKGKHDKWFQSPIPPRGVNLHFPLSDALAKVIAKPTDSPNPADY